MVILLGVLCRNGPIKRFLSETLISLYWSCNPPSLMPMWRISWVRVEIQYVFHLMILDDIERGDGCLVLTTHQTQYFPAGRSWFLNDLWSSLLKHVYYCNQGDERAWPGLNILENTAYILSNHKYQCYQMVTCESDCFLQSLRGELTQENERRRLPLDVLLAWGCITLLGSSASAIIWAITLYNNSLFSPPGFDHLDCPALLL